MTLVPFDKAEREVWLRETADRVYAIRRHLDKKSEDFITLGKAFETIHWYANEGIIGGPES